jgi:hypothetical protein
LFTGGPTISLDEVDDGIADFSAGRKFDSPRAAIDAALEVGAAGRMLEWPGEDDYYCVGQDHRD